MASIIIRAAHLCAMNAAICGAGTIGGEITAQQRKDIYWRVLGSELAKAKAKAAEDDVKVQAWSTMDQLNHLCNERNE